MEVERSGDSAKLAGKTLEQPTKEIVDAAVQKLNQRTGYRRVFKMLAPDKEAIVEHGLKDFPVTDVYELREFEVVCSEDGCARFRARRRVAPRIRKRTAARIAPAAEFRVGC